MNGIVILTTAPDLKTARRLARLLVQKKLAACVNIARGAESFYRWKGRLENGRENLLFIKTSVKRFRRVEALIKNEHPYELPEVIGLPVSRGSKEYLSWLQ